LPVQDEVRARSQQLSYHRNNLVASARLALPRRTSECQTSRRCVLGWLRTGLQLLYVCCWLCTVHCIVQISPKLKSRGFKPGELGVYLILPLRPIYRPGKLSSK